MLSGIPRSQQGTDRSHPESMKRRGSQDPVLFACFRGGLVRTWCRQGSPKAWHPPYERSVRTDWSNPAAYAARLAMESLDRDEPPASTRPGPAGSARVVRWHASASIPAASGEENAMSDRPSPNCPECHDSVDRRDFLRVIRGAATLAVGGALSTAVPRSLFGAEPPCCRRCRRCRKPPWPAEGLCKELFGTLTADQEAAGALAVEQSESAPLLQRVAMNVRLGQAYTQPQGELLGSDHEVDELRRRRLREAVAQRSLGHRRRLRRLRRELLRRPGDRRSAVGLRLLRTSPHRPLRRRFRARCGVGRADLLRRRHRRAQPPQRLQLPDASRQPRVRVGSARPSARGRHQLRGGPGEGTQSVQFHRDNFPGVLLGRFCRRSRSGWSRRRCATSWARIAGRTSTR